MYPAHVSHSELQTTNMVAWKVKAYWLWHKIRHKTYGMKTDRQIDRDNERRRNKDNSLSIFLSI